MKPQYYNGFLSHGQEFNEKEIILSVNPIHSLIWMVAPSGTKMERLLY